MGVAPTGIAIRVRRGCKREMDAIRRKSILGLRPAGNSPSEGPLAVDEELYAVIKFICPSSVMPLREMPPSPGEKAYEKENSLNEGAFM